MNGIIEWFVRNTVAANLTMVAILVVGLMTVGTLRQEVVPNIIMDTAMITVAYPGASPAEVEKGVIMRIEKEVQGLAGVDDVSATANEGVGIVTVNFLEGENRQEMLDDIKAAIDRIDNFPVNTEEPEVILLEMNKRVMNIAIWGDANQKTLREAARIVEDQLILQPDISLVQLTNAPDFEISIEVSEEALRRYQMTFDEVVLAVRSSSIDIPGGGIKTIGEEILLRTQGQAYLGTEFAALPLRTLPNGTRLLLGDVATVVDTFVESDQSNRFNGSPAVILEIIRTGNQEALVMADQALAALELAQKQLPKGIYLDKINDETQLLRGRLDLMLRNGKQGLLLVLIALALFLRLRLALWVTLGIPIAFLGATILMPSMGSSVNLISLFGFIVVLGIVVDDAIVIAENIHEHRQRGKSGLQAAIEGTQEMSKPVIFAVLTTIAAFVPMLLMPGNMGQFARQIPMVVIAVLIFSLVESLLILPAHLTHLPADKANTKLGPWGRLQELVNRMLDAFLRRIYKPSLNFALRNRYLVVALGIALFMSTVGYVQSGRIKFNFFPAMEADNVIGELQMPLGTPLAVTEAGIQRFEDAALELQQELFNAEGKPLIRTITTAVGAQPLKAATQSNGGTYTPANSGSHLAEVNLELLSAEERTMGGKEILALWSERVGQIAGAEEVSFSSDLMAADGDVHIQLAGPDLEMVRLAAEEIKKRMTAVAGVVRVRDSFREGKQEFKLELTPAGEALGFRMGDLGRQVRQAFYGEEAQSIQRDRDEVDVMVRYPRIERESLATLDNMRLRSAGGAEVPLSVAAEASLGRGYSKIDRLDRRRSISVLADIDKEATTPDEVLAALSAEFLPDLLVRYPSLSYTLEGPQKEQSEFMGALTRIMGMSLLAIFVLLAIPLKSYAQPLIIMSAIPFGLIGAIGGHTLLGYDLAIFSLIGIVALSGIVINDSLVMMDLINREREKGIPLQQAVRDSGVRRFRAIMLTTLTTFLGLTPLLLEKSLQAKFLIPMAVSVAFGVVFATLITLLLVPSLYLILEDLKGIRFRKIGPHLRSSGIQHLT
ncbi:MAG: efflux RND transporter permease subunit [Planctomycetota bacterium]|nr:efflux RND transporter permease subunit [Planctomycetota bacterium]MDA1113829.1 efflux RND transporter permease subunit [Planctomycetota bacterium]